jgi:hypothetical protein
MGILVTIFSKDSLVFFQRARGFGERKIHVLVMSCRSKPSGHKFLSCLKKKQRMGWRGQVGTHHPNTIMVYASPKVHMYIHLGPRVAEVPKDFDSLRLGVESFAPNGQGQH